MSAQQYTEWAFMGIREALVSRGLPAADLPSVPDSWPDSDPRWVVADFLVGCVVLGLRSTGRDAEADALANLRPVGRGNAAQASSLVQDVADATSTHPPDQPVGADAAWALRRLERRLVDWYTVLSRLHLEVGRAIHAGAARLDEERERAAGAVDAAFPQPFYLTYFRGEGVPRCVNFVPFSPAQRAAREEMRQRLIGEAEARFGPAALLREGVDALRRLAGLEQGSATPPA